MRETRRHVRKQERDRREKIILCDGDNLKRWKKVIEGDKKNGKPKIVRVRTFLEIVVGRWGGEMFGGSICGL